MLSIPAQQAKQLVGLKITAYREYLAARYLLNGFFLPQAAIFVNSCIEKELKACCFALNVPVNIKHNTFKLYNLLKEKRKHELPVLNSEFLKAITKIYESRYFENLGSGYNYVIVRNKFLAELDFTYSELEPRTKFHRRSETPIRETLYEFDLKNKSRTLYDNNYVLNKIEKNAFLKSPDSVYEFRVIFNHEILEMHYTIPFNKNPNKFLFEAIKPIDETKSYKASDEYHPHVEPVLPLILRNGKPMSGEFA